MRLATWFPRVLGMGVVTLLIVVSVSLADDKKGKPKNDEGPSTTTVDLSKLPPDVAEKILDLVKEAKKSDKKGKKGPDGEKPAPPKEEGKKGPEGEKPAPPKKGEDKKGPEGVKPAPPKEEGKKGPDKKANKSISLTEAIGIAEKLGKGKATKAELKGHDEDAHYTVDVVNKDGEKSKIELTTAGKTREGKGPPKKDEKKKKPKDEEDDE
jgi:uncharacterized membrane protein YkoI